MKNQNIQTKISVLFNKLDVLVQNMGEQQLSGIEIDLVMDYLRQLYDLVNQLQSNENKAHSDSSPITKKKDRSPPVETIESTSLASNPIDKPGTGIQIDDEKEEEENDDYNSINDQFSGPEMLADQLKKSIIKDLRKEIDINDRFWFTQELFNGDAREYEDTVRALQKMTGFNEASAYLNSNVKSRFEWSGKDRIVGKFLNFVRRRFPD